MTDNQPPTDPTDPPPGAITGGPPAPIPAPAPAPAAPGPSLRPLLVNVLLQFGLLAGVWAAAFTALLVSGRPMSDAIGWGLVAALGASFFTRSLLPQQEEAARPVSPDLVPQNDNAREIVETIVFVVVLVLMLKTFVADAFVIPTGSMAQTLYGYQKNVTCPMCGETFPVNASGEVEPSDGRKSPVTFCACPNCRKEIHLYPPGEKNPHPEDPGYIPDPGWSTGDRVLVSKYAYTLGDREPGRMEVVVFRFPGDENQLDFPQSGPVKKHVPINYIKRLVGLPGEVIAISRGKIYALPPDLAPKYDDADNLKKYGGDQMRWRRAFTHADERENPARKLFDEGKFRIIRKSPATQLAMRRPVYDHDHQAKDLTGPEFARWQGGDGSAWKAGGKTDFGHDGTGGDKGYDWLRYNHVLRRSPGKPQLVTDFMAYNAFRDGQHIEPGANWASDLMVECRVETAEAAGSVGLELSRGAVRYQALFDVATGACTLHALEDGKPPVELKTATTALKGKGTFDVRFSDFDDRLTVWVNETLPFGDGVEVGGNLALRPTKENDLERPASVGTRGAKATVSRLKVFRDTYYTTVNGRQPAKADFGEFDPANPETWSGIANAPVNTFYVQPGHYLCMGDNSPESSDGRSWGLVPKRLMLGRAVLVYFPFTRAGKIR